MISTIKEMWAKVFSMMSKHHGKFEFFLKEKEVDELSNSFSKLQDTEGYGNLIEILDIIQEEAVLVLRNARPDDITAIAYCQAYAGLKDCVTGIVEDLSIPDNIQNILDKNLTHKTETEQML